MNRAWLWFILSCKRYAKRLSFFLILLALPLAARGISAGEKSEPVRVRIAVAAEDIEKTEEIEETGEDGSFLEQELAQKLVAGAPEEENPLFEFYLCENEQQVKDEVASKRAECGYVIGRGLRGKLEKKNYKRAIRVYSAPSTVAAGLSNEVVFSTLMELYDKELFTGYVKDSPLFDEAAPVGTLEREELTRQAGELYDTWLYSGSTFRFTAETYGEAALENAAAQTTDAVFPVRGIVAVYIFIIGLYAAVMSLTDERKGLFLAVPYKSRTACRISAMAAPVFLASVSGVMALWSSGVLSGWFRELAAMLLYIAAVTAFSWLLRTVLKNPDLIGCTIPFFLIGSILFCPVMIDASRYFPAAGYVQKLFLPWYYLSYFS